MLTETIYFRGRTVTAMLDEPTKLEQVAPTDDYAQAEGGIMEYGVTELRLHVGLDDGKASITGAETSGGELGVLRFEEIEADPVLQETFIGMFERALGEMFHRQVALSEHFADRNNPRAQALLSEVGYLGADKISILGEVARAYDEFLREQAGSEAKFLHGQWSTGNQVWDAVHVARFRRNCASWLRLGTMFALNPARMEYVLFTLDLEHTTPASLVAAGQQGETTSADDAAPDAEAPEA